MTAEPPGTRQFARIECNESAAAGVLWLMAAVLPLLGFGAIWIAGVPFRFRVPASFLN